MLVVVVVVVVLFSEQADRDSLGITDVQLSLTSLEEVFLTIARKVGGGSGALVVPPVSCLPVTPSQSDWGFGGFKPNSLEERFLTIARKGH